MISKNEEYVLGIGIANERIASEIVVRVIDATPNDAAAAQALLDIISPSENESKEIKEYLTVGMAKKEEAREIADQLDLIVDCLKAQALGVPGNTALNAAQAKLTPLSSKAEKILIICLANRAIAKSIVSKIDIATAQAANIADAV